MSDDHSLEYLFNNIVSDPNGLRRDLRTKILSPVDAVSGALNTIDFSHHKVHEGDTFWVANNATLGNGGINTIAITTPNTTKRVHLLLQIDSTQAAMFEVFEGVTSLAGGAPVLPLNFDRNSENASVVVASVGDTPGADPIVPTGGAIIWTETLGVRGIATSRENASELILKKNSIYLFRVTNGATSNNQTILLTWYEHTDSA